MALAQDLIEAAELSLQRVIHGGPINDGVGEFQSLARKNDASAALSCIQAYVTLKKGLRP